MQIVQTINGNHLRDAPVVQRQSILGINILSLIKTGYELLQCLEDGTGTLAN